MPRTCYERLTVIHTQVLLMGMRADMGPAVRVLRVLETPSEVRDLGWSADGRQLAVATGDGRILLWSPVSTATSPIGRRREIRAHGGPVRAVAWAGSTLLVSAGEDHRVCLWDAQTRQAAHAPYETADEPISLAICPTNPFLVAVGYHTSVV